MSLLSFGIGFRRILELGLYCVLKDELSLQAKEVTFLIGIMTFPQILKMFFAIISDCVTCFGSRRKSYLVVNSAINMLSMLLLMLFA